MAEAVEARMNMFVKCDLASGRRCHDMHQQNTNISTKVNFKGAERNQTNKNLFIQD